MASRISTWIKSRKEDETSGKDKQIELAKSACQKKVYDSTELYVRYINDDIGEGVFTTKRFKKGDFLLEYRGDLLKIKEARRREKDYDEAKLYMYYFKFREKSMCVDATNDIFTEGRMVNDAAPGDPLRNVDMKIVLADKRPHLCMFANRDIKCDEELRYDYGVPNLRWRKCAPVQQNDTDVLDNRKGPNYSTGMEESTMKGLHDTQIHGEEGEKSQTNITHATEEAVSDRVSIGRMVERKHIDEDEDDIYGEEELDDSANDSDYKPSEEESDSSAIIPVIPDLSRFHQNSPRKRKRNSPNRDQPSTSTDNIHKETHIHEQISPTCVDQKKQMRVQHK